MAFSVEDLIGQFRIQIADTKLPYLWTDDQIAVLLNEAEREFAVLTKIFKARVNVDVSPHEAPYFDIPETVIEIHRARMSSGTRPLEIVNFNELDNALTTGDYGDEIVNNWETATGEPRMLVLDETFGKGRLIPMYVNGDDGTVEESLVNPNFDTDITGWTDGCTGAATATVTGGVLTLDYGSAGGARDCFIDQSFVSITGDTYTITVDKVANSSQVSVGTTQGGVDVYAGTDDATDVSYTFIATADLTWIRLENPSGSGNLAQITTASVEHTIDHIHPTIGLHYSRYPTATITSGSANTELTDTRHQMALVMYARSMAYADQDADTYNPALADEYMAKFVARVDQLGGEITRKTRRPGVVRYGGL